MPQNIFMARLPGRKQPTPTQKGVAFYNMGQMYHERGEYSPALSALHKALESINQDGDNAYAESNVQNTLASVYAESEDSLNKAIVHSVTACRLLETSGFPHTQLPRGPGTIQRTAERLLPDRYQGYDR